MKKVNLLLCYLMVAISLIGQDQYTPQGYLGVESNHISRSKAEALGFDNRYGAYVTEVVENTAAEQNGIQPFDYLVGMDDKYFADDWSFSHAMHTTKAGDQANIKLIRNGKEMSIPVTLGKQSEAIYRKVPKEEEPFLGVKQDHYNWKENGPGVKVNIVNNSAAEAMGLQDEDVITAINGQRIVDWHDLGTAVDNMRPGNITKIDFIRNGQENTVSAPMRSYAATYTSSGHNKAKNNPASNSATVQEDSNTEDTEINDSVVNNSILADLEIDMEDITQEEADDMKEKAGVDMPIVNNLEIEQLNIFPNPTSGQFNITFDLPNNGQTTVRVFNGVGRLLYQNDMQQFKGRFQDRVDLSNSPKGIYFLEIRQDGKSLSKKVIVQ